MENTKEKISWQYAKCVTTTCPKASTCLRSIAWKDLPKQERFTTVLNPSLTTEDDSCPYYRDNKPQRYARGFENFQRRMFPGQYAEFMRRCVARFGRNPYFMRRRGETPISPNEQAFIKQTLRDVGVKEDLEFDSFEDRLNWDDD